MNMLPTVQEVSSLTVISDSTPLHYLILINEVSALRQLYGKVIVPIAVVRELSAAKTPRLCVNGLPSRQNGSRRIPHQFRKGWVFLLWA
jgi:hypothetical protein